MEHTAAAAAAAVTSSALTATISSEGSAAAQNHPFRYSILGRTPAKLGPRPAMIVLRSVVLGVYER